MENTKEKNMMVPPVSEILETGEKGTRINRSFLVTTSDVREARNGAYVDLTLRDKTGSINGKIWNSSIAPAPNSIVIVDAVVEIYKDKPQLKVESYEVLNVLNSSLTERDFVPSSHVPASELWESCSKWVSQYCTPAMSALVHYIVDKHKERFLEARAASSNHHARHGGLVEHIHSMCTIGITAAQHYRIVYGPDAVDMSVLIAGIVLHDIGKIKEIDETGTYTEEGNMIGHIPLGLMMFEEGTQKFDSPMGAPLPLKSEFRAVKHLILSHHGRYEWGSPVLPLTTEALLLHQLDLMDSQFDKKVGQ